MRFFYRPSQANKIINVAVQIMTIIVGQARKREQGLWAGIDDFKDIAVGFLRVCSQISYGIFLYYVYVGIVSLFRLFLIL